MLVETTENHQSKKSRGVCRGMFLPTLATPSNDGPIRQEFITRLIPKMFPASKSMETQIEFDKCVSASDELGVTQHNKL